MASVAHRRLSDNLGSVPEAVNNFFARPRIGRGSEADVASNPIARPTEWAGTAGRSRRRGSRHPERDDPDPVGQLHFLQSLEPRRSSARSARSGAGAGSRILKSARSPADNLPVRSSPSEGPMARILVIDDEQPIRELLRHVLEKEGHEVVEAQDGKDALRLAEQSPPDLVITDIMMPEQDGLEVIRALRRESPDLKMLAISGGGLLRSRALHVANLLGAFDTLQKPFALDVL